MKSFNQRLVLQGKQLMTMGVKLPPYVYSKQFEEVAAALKTVSANTSTISFITCTNTLGSSLLFAEQSECFDNIETEFALPTTHGGMAGDAIHTLSLGCALQRLKNMDCASSSYPRQMTGMFVHSQLFSPLTHKLRISRSLA